MSNHNKPLFPLGHTIFTMGALDAFIRAGQTAEQFLQRHQMGDWGDMVEADKEQNNLAAEEGLRIFSAYKLATGVEIWVITEWNRSATTILLPEEY
ncbi:hypothetical protein [Candidatus Leptofilum sp.]|uniref:hypothetical protein n=1 Tax=Candidatus Leptofilum sp. TaxID=3241576 RepID=UPI003B5BC17C